MNAPPPRPRLKDRFRAAAAELWLAGKGQAAKIGPAAVAGWALLAFAVAWCYWSPVAALAGRWWSEPDYLYGFLVPVFAAYLLWFRRGMLAGAKAAGSWWGLGLLGVCAALQLTAAYYLFDLLAAASLCFCLAGLALLLGGRRVLAWAWPSAAFLVFMVPLPGLLANLLSHPLQRVATISSTYIVQTVGIPAVAEGNVISLSEGQIGVAEACSGLRNMMLFIVICTGTAFLVQRTLLEKAIIVLSAAPIALAANIGRITLTALLHNISRHDLANTMYHDLAAWLMMPLAVVLLWIEMALLKRIFVTVAPDSPTVNL
jgi:exosortase